MRGCGPAMGVLACGSATRNSYNLPGKDLVRIGDSIEIGPVYIRPQLRIAVVLLGVGTQCVATRTRSVAIRSEGGSKSQGPRASSSPFTFSRVEIGIESCRERVCT